MHQQSGRLGSTHTHTCMHAPTRSPCACIKKPAVCLVCPHNAASALGCLCLPACLQGKQVLQDGIGRATEVEEPLDPAAARALLDAPSDLLALPGSELMRNLASTYGLTQLVCLGGFNNVRQEVAWRGFTLELDETRYPWGTLYELEAETVRV